MNGARIIKAKYSTMCHECKGVVRPGSVAYWEPGKGTTHLGCRRL